MLLEHAGEVVSREELRGRLWPEDVFVDFDNNLNCSVAKLREVLHDSAEHPRFIETLPKHGYRFIASISRPAVTPDLTQAHKAGVECLDIPSIVALPTKVFGASEAAFLTDAVPSTLSTMLAGVAGIDTKVPPSSVEFELIKGDLTKIAEAYHVENLVLTTVTAHANHLVLNVEVADAATRKVGGAANTKARLTGTTSSPVRQRNRSSGS